MDNKSSLTTIEKVEKGFSAFALFSLVLWGAAELATMIYNPK